MNTNYNSKQQFEVLMSTKKSKLFLAIILLTFICTFCENANAQVTNWPGKNVCGTVQPATVSLWKPDTIVNGDSVIIIPTVFHILTQGKSDNISKSQVNNALQNLNRYFNRLNSDTANVPAPFQSIRGNQKVEFRLARFDPQGNCTEGIDRIYSPLTNGPGGIGNNWQMQPNFDWDHVHYINIYVVNYVSMNDGLVGGAAYLAPIDSGQNYPAFNDALTIGYNYMGDGVNGYTLPWF